MPKIFYTSHAPEEVYDIIRAEMPAGFELVTLERDDDAERREKIAGCEVVIVAATPLFFAMPASTSPITEASV